MPLKSNFLKRSGIKSNNTMSTEKKLIISMDSPQYALLIKGDLPVGMEKNGVELFRKFLKDGAKLRGLVAAIKPPLDKITAMFPQDSEASMASRDEYEVQLARLLMRSKSEHELIYGYFAAVIELDLSLIKAKKSKQVLIEKMEQLNVKITHGFLENECILAQAAMDEAEKNMPIFSHDLSNSIIGPQANDVNGPKINEPSVLRQSDIDRINKLFSYIGDTKQLIDIAVMFFIIMSEIPALHEASFASEMIKKGYSKDMADKIIAMHKKLYMFGNYYWQNCINAVFKKKDSQVNSIMPNDANSLLPILFAAGFTHSIEDALPINFEYLLEQGLVENLPDHVLNIFVKYYSEKFNRQNKQLKTRQDVFKLYPYQLVEITYQNGRAYDVLDCVARDKIVGNFTEDINFNPLEYFLTHYQQICKYLKDSIETLDVSTGSFGLEISTHGDNDFIDIIIISPKNDVVIIQIDKSGRLLGVPQGYEGDVENIANRLLSEVTHNVIENRLVGHERQGFIRASVKPINREFTDVWLQTADAYGIIRYPIEPKKNGTNGRDKIRRTITSNELSENIQSSNSKKQRELRPRDTSLGQIPSFGSRQFMSALRHFGFELREGAGGHKIAFHPTRTPIDERMKKWPFPSRTDFTEGTRNDCYNFLRQYGFSEPEIREALR